MFLSKVLRGEWDKSRPLGVVVVFIVAAAAILAAGYNFGIPERDVERIHTLYTEIGVQVAASLTN